MGTVSYLIAFLGFLAIGATAQTPGEECQSIEATERWAGGFEFGHIDNRFGKIVVASEFTGIVLAEHDPRPMESVLVQIRGEGTNRKVLKLCTHRSGTFQFRNLPPGTYYFVAVAVGFQSVSGRAVIQGRAMKQPAVALRLPLGV